MNYLVVTTSAWTASNGDIVPSGTAINSIEADAGFDPGVGLELQEPASQPWYKPTPMISEVPETVALWQAKAALAAVGKLDAATQIVTALGGNVALAWEYGNTIDRDSPTVLAMSAQLGLAPEDLDKLFVMAAGFIL